MRKKKGFIVAFLLLSTVILSKGQGEVRDYDGNTYKILKVGNQHWMVENLKVTHYLNGDAIPNVKDNKEWDSLTSGAYADPANNPVKVDKQGRIYNWYVVADKRNVCPEGWHVPSESEWQEMIMYLAKNTGTKEINASLFDVLQEDFRGYDGGFSGNGYGGGGWWTSTPVNSELAFYHGINYNTASKNRLESRKKFGYSIRCIKD